MDSLEFVKTRLLAARETRGALKEIERATSIKGYALWRIASGKTPNPGVRTVETLHNYFSAKDSQ